MNRLSWILMASVAVLPAVASAEIGSVAAVNRDMDGTPPAADRRELNLGNRVVTDELIQTSPLGSGQLMFLDQTTLTVAPESNIVLDEYVYDPDTQVGDMTLSITRGALRLIGGRITKKSEAIIQTPTATVGIRGGLAIIEVDADGTTRVILLAGEYVRVKSKNETENREVILSRPNAWAEIRGGGAPRFAGLIPPEVLERLYKLFEGQGDGGSATAAVAIANAAIEQVTRLNSGEEGGDQRPPISTSGEEAKDDRTEGDQERGDDPFDRQSDQPPPGQEFADTGDRAPPIEPPDPIDPPPTSIEFIPPGSGAFASPSIGVVGFDNVFTGSLIGENSGQIFVEAFVPELADDLDQSFGGNETTFFAVENGFNTGFFELESDGGELFDPFLPFESQEPDFDGDFDGGTLNVNDVLPQLGDVTVLDYTGFADVDQLFYVAQFTATQGPSIDPSNIETGQFVFGDPSFFQGLVLNFDNLDEAPTANTVGAYRIEPNLNENGPADLPGQDLLIIANGGELTFNAPSSIPGVTIFTGGNSSGSSTEFIDFQALEANGGRVLSGEASVGQDGESSFRVFAQGIAQDAEGLSFGGSALGSALDQEGLLSFSTQGFGTLENNDGQTTYGFSDDYIVLSSFLRPGGDPDADYEFTPGETQFLGFGQPDENGFAQNVLTRNRGADQIVRDPFPIVQNDNAAASLDFALDGYAAGLALCSDGECGRDLDPRPPEPEGAQNEDLAGAYNLRTRNFGSSRTGIVFDASDSGGDSNSFALQLFVDTDGDGNLGFPSLDGSESFVIASSTSVTGVGAYASDDVFGVAEELDVTVTVPGIGNLKSNTAPVALASAAAVDIEDLIPQANQSEFLVWGFWSAPLDVTVDDNRTDLVHMGTFVMGAEPDASLLPTDVTVSYSGFAIGSQFSFDTRAPQIVTGDFSMNYDFARAQGTNFNINIGGVNITSDNFSGSSRSGHQYSVFASTSDGILSADGRFFSGDGGLAAAGAAAATAGSFAIDDPIGESQIVGNFGGDAVSAVPSFIDPGSAFVTDPIAGSGTDPGTVVVVTPSPAMP